MNTPREGCGKLDGLVDLECRQHRFSNIVEWDDEQFGAGLMLSDQMID
jgi:hypothetical protein